MKKQIDSIVADISEDNGIGEERVKKVTKMEQAYRLAILPIRGVKDD